MSSKIYNEIRAMGPCCSHTVILVCQFTGGIIYKSMIPLVSQSIKPTENTHNTSVYIFNKQWVWW